MNQLKVKASGSQDLLPGESRGESGAALPSRMKRFADSYMEQGGIKMAAIAAGYSPKTASSIGWRLIRREDVQAYIKAESEYDQITTGITRRNWLLQQKVVGYSDISDYMEFGPDGVTLKKSDEIPPDLLKAISEISETVTKDGGTVRFKLHNKLDALKMIGEHFGWLKSKPDDQQDMRPLVIINKIVRDKDEPDGLRSANPTEV